MKCVEEINTAV